MADIPRIKFFAERRYRAFGSLRRRPYTNAASSFWPCQINCLKAYLKAIVGANIGFSIVSRNKPIIRAFSK
jgi:hypothetical protein